MTYGAPFSVFVPTNLLERRGSVLVSGAEPVIAANDSIVLTIDYEYGRSLIAPSQKSGRLFFKFGMARALPSEAAMLESMYDFSTRYGVDMPAVCASLFMDRDETAALASDPLATIGAHTVNHIMLGRADEATVRSELNTSRDVLESKARTRGAPFRLSLRRCARGGRAEFAMQTSSSA